MTGVVLLIIRILAVISLYAFLGITLFYLWQSFKQDTDFLESNEKINIDFLMNTGTNEEKIIHFNKINIEIGRDENCDLILNDNTVSNRHARIAFHHGHWWVNDLQSTNGTCLNGEIIKNPAIVINGDVISCGKNSFTLILQDETKINPGEIE